MLKTRQTPHRGLWESWHAATPIQERVDAARCVPRIAGPNEGSLLYRSYTAGAAAACWHRPHPACMHIM